MAQIADTSRQGKLTRVINLKMRGLTDTEIAEQMLDEGYKRVSRRTVQRLIHSADGREMAEQLLMLQLRDITQADISLRLKYRDRLLDKILGRPSTLINIEQSQTEQKLEVRGTRYEWSIEQLLGEYGEEISEAVETRIIERSREAP